MAESVSAIDDAIAHLNSLISRLQGSSAPAATPSNPAPELPNAEPAAAQSQPAKV